VRARVLRQWQRRGDSVDVRGLGTKRFSELQGHDQALELRPAPSPKRRTRDARYAPARSALVRHELADPNELFGAIVWTDDDEYAFARPHLRQ